MRSEYDFSQSRKNPYAKQLKRQVTIRLDIGDALSKPDQSLPAGLCHAETAARHSMARGIDETGSRPPTLSALIPPHHTCESNSRLTVPSYSN